MLTAAATAADPGKSTPFDPAGHRGSTIELGKMKMKMIVKVAKSPDGRLSGKIDLPDQGARDIPVSAMLSNFPAVRWEIDPFDNMAFNGTVSSDGNEIAGQFDTARRKADHCDLQAARPSSRRTRSHLHLCHRGSPGHSRLLEGGHCRGARHNKPRRVKIGRAPDGTFGVLLDLLDRGATDVSASSVTWTNSAAKFEWQLFRIVFECKLDEKGDRLAGNWQQGGKSFPVSFERLQKPASSLPDDVSFTPDPGVSDDIRGDWQGVLETPDNGKLRLVLRVGKTPDGSFAGTLASPDQGPGTIPMSSGGVTNNQVRLEWKAINGVYKGTITNQGAVLDGTWEQMGPGLKLKLERAATAAESKGTHQ